MADEVISRRRMIEDVGPIADGGLPGSGFTLAGALSVASQRMFDWLDENV